MKCSAFWNHTNIRSGNRIYPCCRFKTSIGQFDGDVGNVLHIPEYKKIREANAKGEFIKGCEKCWYEEKIGHKSLRQEFNEKYTTDNVELKFLEIGFDNLCNLTCDGCNSEFSTSWIIKEKQIYGEAKNKLMEIDEVTNVPDTINKILFLGGEPLITDRHLKLLRQVKNKDIEIIYNTNGTFIPSEEVLEEFKLYKQVTFILSVDGVKELAEKVRSGTKWSKVLDFVEWVKQNKFTLEFNTVVHTNNWHGLEDIYNFCTRHDAKWYVNCLTYPFELSINRLSYMKKRKLRNILKEVNVPNKDFILAHLDTKPIV